MTVDRFDSFNSTCDFSTGDRTTFINPNYEFTAKGRVKAFEAHITRKGYIVFQVVRFLNKPLMRISKRLLGRNSGYSGDERHLLSHNFSF